MKTSAAQESQTTAPGPSCQRCRGTYPNVGGLDDDGVEESAATDCCDQGRVELRKVLAHDLAHLLCKHERSVRNFENVSRSRNVSYLEKLPIDPSRRGTQTFKHVPCRTHKTHLFEQHKAAPAQG